MTEKSFVNKANKKGSNPTKKTKRAPKGSRFARWVSHGYEVPNEKFKVEDFDESYDLEEDDSVNHITIEIDFSYVGWILLIVSIIQIILDNYGHS